MEEEQLNISYSEELKPLEELLKQIDRPGDYYVTGTEEIVSMPNIEVQEVGTLSFPIPEVQIKQMILHSTRGPFGRGTETVLDTSVRNVWQLTPTQFKISGPLWSTDFGSILTNVTEGLGCAKEDEKGDGIKAELYKMLIYEEGGFFLPHRDTEKENGMFGTLVLCLPSCHEGGELVIRHAGNEVSLDLNCNSEVSIINYAAFYADCEHEAKPVRSGYRVCLVYNLIQTGNSIVEVPSLQNNDERIKAAANIIDDVLTDEYSSKIAFLLEHDYTPASLSFQSLKNADAANVKFLTQAAKQADCEIYLGIVHIEELRDAQYCYHKRSRWNTEEENEKDSDEENDLDEEDEEDDDDDDDGSEGFEAGDLLESKQYIDHWKDLNNKSCNFGQIPLDDESELFPNGALDSQPPDEENFMEATGNEGATYERFYLRAVAVIWKKEKHVQILLQAGFDTAIAHLSKLIHSNQPKLELVQTASIIVNKWETKLASRYWKTDDGNNAWNMLQLLVTIGEKNLLDRFITSVICKEYDRNDNQYLIEAFQMFDDEFIEKTVKILLDKNFSSCLDLLFHLKQHTDVIKHVANQIVTNLMKLHYGSDFKIIVNIWFILKPVDGEEDALKKIVEYIISSPGIFDPITILAPALMEIRDKEQQINDQRLVRIWEYISEILLNRSEFPPIKPKTWQQQFISSCNCEDCKKVNAFVVSNEIVGRFRFSEKRRNHVEQFARHTEMKFGVERVGNPYTLVCTKTTKGYDKLVERHQNDLQMMRKLLHFPIGSSAIQTRMKTALQQPSKVKEVITVE